MTAIQAAREAGIEVARVEVDKDGKIIIVAGKPADVAGLNNNENPWDVVYASHEKRAS